MQSRRHEDIASQSSFDRRQRNVDLDRDSYLMMSPRSKRSWSPRQMEGPAYPERHPERAMAGRRSVSLERIPRRPVDDGIRSIRSRSPPYFDAKRGRPYYRDDWVTDRVTDRDLSSPERRSRYGFIDRMDRGRDDVDDFPGNELGYGSGSFRTAVRDDKFEVRRFDSGIRELSSQKPAVTELYKPIGDVGPTTKPQTTAASLNADLGQPGKERVHYPDVRDPYSFNTLTSMKHFEDEDKHMAHPRDTSDLTAIRYKESVGASHYKDYARTSPRKSRIDYLDYQGDIPFSRDDPSLKSRHIEPSSHSRYEQRHHLDLRRGTDLDTNDDMGPYMDERFTPPRTGNLDSFRPQPRTRETDAYLYPSDEVYERSDYNGRDILRPNLLNRVGQRVETSDIAHRNMSSRRSLDRIPLTATANIGLSRSPAEKRESAQYVDTVTIHSRIGRKVLREDERPYMGMAQDLEPEHARVDFDYQRDLRSDYHKDRIRSFQGVSHEREHEMEGHDLYPYDSSSRYLKRKYTMEDEEIRIPSRGIMRRLGTVNRKDIRDFDDEEWVDQDVSVRRSNFSERRVEKVYGEHEFSYDPDEFIYDHDYHMRSHEYDDRYAKDYSRSGGRVGYNPNHLSRRKLLPRWKNMPTRGENEKDAVVYSREIEQYEPHEDTEEFKQLVNDYFLSFTKKLNENPSVRWRYMEQGRAGSLFCIVCGRSASKEFLDTQRLAMHAYMSHKGGLRAQHLGLLKAICVILGWNSVLPADTPRWFPVPLSDTETLVQKQDLIIWPPVVIVHNISILNNNSNGEGPTTVEALGQFLRGVGLSGGKVKPGKPSNSSIMLVKFLGTFSGLQDAEKMHQYFSKKKHGRKHLDQITSSKGKSKREENAEKEGERVLFGYMGNAEDLDKLDIDTKRKCSIKSKKEIQDIADAPVKPGG